MFASYVYIKQGSETKIHVSLLGNWLKVATVTEICNILTTIHEGSRVHAGYQKVFADVSLWMGGFGGYMVGQVGGWVDVSQIVSTLGSETVFWHSTTCSSRICEDMRYLRM